MKGDVFELTFRELLSILFKEWRKVSFAFLVAVLVTVGWSYTIQPYYTATSDLLVKTGREFQVRPDAGQSIVSVPYVSKREIINSEIAIMTSKDLVGSIIEKVGLTRIFPQISKQGTDATTADFAIRRFLGEFIATPIEQSNVIRVSYSNTDRDVALNVLQVAIDLYQRKHASMYSERQDVFLGQQTRDYKARLDDIDRQIAALKRANGIFDVDAQRGKLVDERSAIMGLIQQLAEASRGAEAEIAGLRRELGATEPGNREAAKGATTTEAAAKWRVLGVDVQAEALRQRELASRRAAITELDQQLAALEKGAQGVAELEREKHAIEDLLRTYRTRLEEARVTSEELEKRDLVSVQIMQPPYAPLERSGPRHLLYGIAGLLMGVLAASGTLLYLLFFRETFVSADSVERLIGVRVLGSIRAH